MYLEASDHACPHLREQKAATTRPAPVAAAPQAGCPFGGARAAAEPLRVASTSSSAGGWWAFASQARAVTAAA